MSENARRINVTLPGSYVERIKEVMASDPARHPSVSAFVAEAVRHRLAEEDAHDVLVEMLHADVGEPTAEDRAWAADAIRHAEKARQERLGREGGR